MTQPTPSPLTREQIESLELSVQAGDARAIHMLAQDVLVLTASHEALRLTIEQQAQEIESLRKQLKDIHEAQARLDKYNHWTPEHTIEEWLADRQRIVSTKQAEADAQLQATLVAREETIRQLSVANQYFAMSEETLAKQRDALNVTCVELSERVTELEGDFMVVTEQRLALTIERDAAVQDAARLRARLAMLEEGA